MFKLGINIEIYEFKSFKKTSERTKEYKSLYTAIKSYDEIGIIKKPKDLIDLVKQLERKYWIEGFDTTHIKKEGKIYISIKNKTEREERVKK